MSEPITDFDNDPFWTDKARIVAAHIHAVKADIWAQYSTEVDNPDSFYLREDSWLFDSLEKAESDMENFAGGVAKVDVDCGESRASDAIRPLIDALGDLLERDKTPSDTMFSALGFDTYEALKMLHTKLKTKRLVILEDD